MTAIQNKAFSLAGLMYALRGIAYAHEGKAGITVPANASSSFPHRCDVGSFETSTRVRVSRFCRTMRGDANSPDLYHSGYGYHMDDSEFLESIKKSLPLCGNTVYGYKAPHKTGAGIGVLKILKATYDAPSVFFYVVGLTHPFFGRWCIIQRLCQSMVAQAGASSEAPVSFRAGYANPVWATTSEIGVSGGSVTCYLKEAATCWLLPLPKNRNLSGLSPQFAAIARQLPPKFIILLPSLNAMLAVLWCAITSAFLLVVSAWRWHMIKTYDVHMDPLERTSQIITLTEVINDILVSNSPSRDERLKALLAILDLAVRDVHFLLEGGEMPGKTGATNE